MSMYVRAAWGIKAQSELFVDLREGVVAADPVPREWLGQLSTAGAKPTISRSHRHTTTAQADQEILPNRDTFLIWILEGSLVDGP